MIVTIDFDGTLSRNDVQEYAKELIDRGIDVWVLTSRYDNLHKHLWEPNPSNVDLYAVLDIVGIPYWKVVFLNMDSKHDYLDNTFVVWHLDDDKETLDEINYYSKYTGIKGISVDDANWRKKCDKTLIKHS